MTIRDIAIAFGYEVDNKSEKKVEKSIAGLKNMAKSAFRAIGLGLSLVKANALVEEFTETNQQLKNAVGESENFADVQDRILQAANDSKLSYAGMSTYVKGLLNTQNSLFSTVEKTAEFAELTTKAFKAAGANESAINSLSNGIKSAFTTGKVSAGTFNQLMENCPDSVEYLSKTLGVSERQVKALGTAGAITSNQLYSAFANNAGAIEKSFSNTAFKISDAITYIRNKFGTWLYQLNDTLKVTQTISKIMVGAFDKIHGVLKKVTGFVEKLNNKLGGAEKTLKLFAAIGASLFIAMKADKILGFVKALGAGLSFINLQSILLAAKIIALVLVVEDIINFIKGNNSLFGEILSSAGIDVEKTRNAFKKFVSLITSTAKSFVPALSKSIKVCANAFSATVKVVSKIISFFNKHKTLAQLLAYTIGLLTVAVKAYNIAQAISNAGGVVAVAQLAAVTVAETAHTVAATVAAVATTAFGAALNFLTAPITLVILAIGALIAIIVLCVKHWDKIKAAASKVWDWIVGAFQGVIDWVKKNWKSIILFIINPFAGIFKYLYDNFEGFRNFVDNVLGKVKGAFKGVIDWVKSNWKSIVLFLINPFAGVFKYLYDNFEGFRDFVLNIVNQIKESFISAFEGIANVFGKIGSFFKGIFGGNDDIDVKSIAEGVIDMGNPAPATGVLNNSTSNRTLTQNVSITNQFNGGTTEQQKTGSTAMKRSADDATGIMARGLAYAR